MPTYLPMQHRTITFFSNILVDWVESRLKDGPARSFVLIDVILLKLKTSKGLQLNQGCNQCINQSCSKAHLVMVSNCLSVSSYMFTTCCHGSSVSDQEATLVKSKNHSVLFVFNFQPVSFQPITYLHTNISCKLGQRYTVMDHQPT